MILGAHQGGAVRERPADALAIEPAGVCQRAGEIGMGERCPPESCQGDMACGDVRRRGLRGEFLSQL
jgi:hypothetical protein